ncbi:Hypothetical_protein [Hexamita inflata]|uniref:Hypothetical_protein n=1 Tax=Hexamita inflata TaxID=28002 RepID=A0AA86U3B7_9EUKA|nr:Hypothetical protein HINF_LOCUS28230 [Hexamita inflata]
MSSDINILAQMLTLPDRALFNKWREILELPQKNRLVEKTNQQYMRLLCLQLTCISQNQIKRLEDPFDQLPKQKLEQLRPGISDRYRTLMMRTQLSSQQQKTGQREFSQIVKDYNQKSKVVNSPSIHKARLPLVKQISQPMPEEDLGLTQEVQDALFDPSQRYCSSDFTKPQVQLRDVVDEQVDDKMFKDCEAVEERCQMDELEYTYFSATIQRLKNQ